ncbi:MAG: hypothetical protein ACO1OG_03535 [Devosia sp.]
MKFSGPLTRSIALVGLLIAAPLSAVPAFAAAADVALLKSYVGDWRGRGELIGAEKESVVCRLSLTPGNQDKVNYSGRCSLAGSSLSVSGTLAYNEAARRYEAAMTSNVTFTGLAVGKKQGNNIVFNLKEKNKDEEGRDLTVSAAIVLSGNGEKIAVDFNVVFNATGETLKASVPFSK